MDAWLIQGPLLMGSGSGSSSRPCNLSAVVIAGGATVLVRYLAYAWRLGLAALGCILRWWSGLALLAGRRKVRLR